MRFALDDDQQMVADAARDYLERLPGARALLEGADPVPGGWASMVEEQSWPSLAVPETLDHADGGGFGFDQVATGLVLEALGRTLVPSPMLGVAWATAALLECPPAPARDAALARITEGATACVVWDDDPVVVDGLDAELAVCVTPDGAWLVPGLEGATRTALPSLDPTRALARLDLACVERVPVGGPEVHPLARARAMALLACGCVGVAEAVMDLAVDYAKVRAQFGGPIGRFQAVQHLCADMLVRVESARSAAWAAAWTTCGVANPARTADAARSAGRTALATAADAAFANAGASIQVHGGIGFTWEHVCHLYFKRARTDRTLLGEPRRHRAALADQLLGGL